MKLSLVKFSSKAHTETGVTICIFDILSHQAHLLCNYYNMGNSRNSTSDIYLPLRFPIKVHLNNVSFYSANSQAIRWL